jgi:hypothetical protein
MRARAGDESALERYFTFGEGDDAVARGKAEAARVLSRADTAYRVLPEACPYVIAVQVKEKYGTLRFYYNGGDDVVDGIVRMAEAMSAITCEVCGAPGKMLGDGWVTVRCEEHEG